MVVLDKQNDEKSSLHTENAVSAKLKRSFCEAKTQFLRS